MKTLINKFPNGLQEDDPLYAPKLDDQSGDCTSSPFVTTENYFQDQSNATAHSGEIILDPAIISGEFVTMAQQNKFFTNEFNKHFLRERLTLLLKAME